MKKKLLYLFIPFLFQSILVFGQQQQIIFTAVVNNIKTNINYFSPNDTLHLGDTIHIEIIFNQIGSSQFTLGAENNFVFRIKKLRVEGMNPTFSLEFRNNILSKENRVQDEIKFFSSLSKTTVRDTLYMTTQLYFAVQDTSAQSFNGTPALLPNLDKFTGYIDFIQDFSSFKTQQKYYRSINFTAKMVHVNSKVIDILNTIERESSPQSFSLTPNPSTTGLFHISGIASNIQVYNAQGNSIVPNFINDHTLDLSAFPNGMYVVVANVGGAMVTKKINID